MKRRKGERQRDFYRRYLSSDEWNKRRLKTLKRWGYQCIISAISKKCRGKLHCHHRTYVRLGNEKAHDLIVLCEYHHKLFHDDEKQKSIIRKITGL